jgi:trehalose-phosphatase
LVRVASRLACKLPSTRGAWLEDKGLTLSLHVREVAPSGRPALVRALKRLLRSELHNRLVRLTRGRLVWEVRPAVPWDKGRAVAWFCHRVGASRPGAGLAFYIGDDTSDEAAFRAVNRIGGISILVGRNPMPRRTSARYRLRVPGDVRGFLESLLRMLSARSK